VIHIVWEFCAKQGSEAEFEGRYGPSGAWVQLFRRSSGYLGTTLLRDSVRPRRYLLTDTWEEEASFERFRMLSAREYEELDRSCEGLTEGERLIGRFQPILRGEE
jgi:heme-degrading monooxygenase HmoA